MILYGASPSLAARPKIGTPGVCQPRSFPPRNFSDSFKTFSDCSRHIESVRLIEDVEGIKVKRKWLRRFEVTRIGWNYPKNRLLKLKIHPYGQNVKFLFAKPVKLSYISYIEMTFWLVYRHLEDLSCKNWLIN